jgi:hypothetical protein
MQGHDSKLTRRVVADSDPVQVVVLDFDRARVCARRLIAGRQWFSTAKRAVLGIVTLFVCQAGVGQGYVLFRNFEPGWSAPVFAGDYVTKLSGPQYYVGLLAGPDPVNLTLVATTPFLSGASVGMFSGGGVMIPNVPSGGTAWIRVVAWDTTLGGITEGASFFQAQASGGLYWGESAVLSVVTGGPPPEIPASLTGLTSFAVPSCLTIAFYGIFTQPTNQAVVLGDTATFYVQGGGCPPPSYQWYFNGSALPGATRSVCQITNAQRTDAGSYSALLSNPAWGGHTSAAAILTIIVEPIVTSQPQPQTAYVGTSVNFQVGASGARPLTYQWFFNDRSIAGAADASLTMTNVQLSQSGNYAVVITNPYGAVTSTPASLTVVASLPRILLPPWNRTVVAGGFADFVVGAEGSLPLGYQWFFNGNALASATGTALHLANIQLSQSGDYAVAVTNAFGVLTSGPAVLNVINASNIPAGTIVGWGAVSNLPAGLSNVLAISAGGDHDLALKSDGTVVAWGQNTFGQCTVPDGLGDIIAVSAGTSHSLALKADGTVAAWGWNYRGQTDVPTGLSNVIAIAASGVDSLALKSDGTVVAWGENLLGEGTIPANLNGVIAIASGPYHALALRFDGTVVAWGNNPYGQGSVPANLAGVTAIATGGDNDLALKSDGTVMAWGGDYYGQSTGAAGLSGITAIAAGADFFNGPNTHCLALKVDGTVLAWGMNLEGQASVPPGLAGVIAVSAGAYHSLALVKQPAVVVAYPESQTAEVGATVTLVAHTDDFQPLSFQWFHNATNALGSLTDDVLQLRSVQPVQAGNYCVVVTDAFGAATSAPVTLSVISPVQRRRVSALTLTGPLGSVLNLETADALTPAPNWTALDRLVLRDSPQWYFDLTAPFPKQRFYRAWQFGETNEVRQLDNQLLPALTLNGAIGSIIRVEAIHQFGPIDAWFPLATVTLTNTTQFYFDVTAPGTPARLYRLITSP